MRIFKVSNDVLTKIVTEMLNIEASKTLYVDGVLNPNPEVGYPKITVDDTELKIKASTGYIYYSGGTDIEPKLIKDLNDLIVKMEPADHLKDFQSIIQFPHTNIKAKNWQTRSVAHDGTTRVVNTSGTKRLIITSGSYYGLRNTRFVWVVKNISTLQLSNFSSPDSNTYIEQHLCSIMYDRENITTLTDNTYVEQFKSSMLYGGERALNRSIMLSKHFNPIYLELNPTTKTQFKRMYFRASPLKTLKKKIYNRTFEDLGLDANYKYTCNYCKALLYDDNYVLTQPFEDPFSPEVQVACPVCVHKDKKQFTKNGAKDLNLEKKFALIFRVKFPTTINDAINAVAADETHSDILRQAMEKIVVYHDYVLIGDKYIGVMAMDSFYFRGLARKYPERKAVTWECHKFLVYGF